MAQTVKIWPDDGSAARDVNVEVIPLPEDSSPFGTRDALLFDPSKNILYIAYKGHHFDIISLLLKRGEYKPYSNGLYGLYAYEAYHDNGMVKKDNLTDDSPPDPAIDSLVAQAYRVWSGQQSAPRVSGEAAHMNTHYVSGPIYQGHGGGIPWIYNYDNDTLYYGPENGYHYYLFDAALGPQGLMMGAGHAANYSNLASGIYHPENHSSSFISGKGSSLTYPINAIASAISEAMNSRVSGSAAPQVKMYTSGPNYTHDDEHDAWIHNKEKNVLYYMPGGHHGDLLEKIWDEDPDAYGEYEAVAPHGGDSYSTIEAGDVENGAPRSYGSEGRDRELDATHPLYATLKQIWAAQPRTAKVDHPGRLVRRPW